MKLINVVLVSALAITPAALLAQTPTFSAPVVEAINESMPVVTEQVTTPAVAVTAQPALQESDKTAQENTRPGIKTNVVPNDSAAIGSSLDANDLDSLPMEGRDALSIVGSNR